MKPGPDSGGGLVNEYVRVDVRENSFTASMLAFAPDGTALGVLDSFSLSRGGGSHPPSTPVITGPATINAFGSASLELSCSGFADPDPGDEHLQSRWRLSHTADVHAAGATVLEQVTGANVTTCSFAASNLWPGQTLYASVQHTASDGMVSEFAVPITIQVTPDPLYFEDFESIPEFGLPEGWVAGHHTTVVANTWNPDDPLSNTYLTWTAVATNRLSALGANRVNVPAIVYGQSVYAESDHRNGVQIQYLTTRDFDLRSATNVHLLFRSNYMQNQDSLAALEYSIDRGSTWLPVSYLLDTPDVIRTPDGLAIDAVATFTRVDPDGVPTANGSAASGGTYGEHILARPFASLGANIQGRLNDDTVESKRIERYRLSAADRQPAVRFRFMLVGTASWFWAVDDFGLYGNALTDEQLRVTSCAVMGNGLQLSWVGPPGPYQVQFRAILGAGLWEDYGAPIDAAQHSAVLPTNGITGFYRIRLAR